MANGIDPQWVAPRPETVYGPGVLPPPDGDALRKMLEGQALNKVSEAQAAAQSWALRRAELDDAAAKFEIAKGRLEDTKRQEAESWERLSQVARPAPAVAR